MNTIIIGAGISIIGWGVLLFFSGVDTGFRQEAINIHRLAIANNIILLGYVFMVIGGFNMAIDKLRQANNDQRDTLKPIGGTANGKYSAGDDQFLDWDEYSQEDLEKLSMETSNKEDADSINAWKDQSTKKR